MTSAFPHDLKKYIFKNFQKIIDQDSEINDELETVDDLFYFFHRTDMEERFNNLLIGDDTTLDPRRIVLPATDIRPRPSLPKKFTTFFPARPTIGMFPSFFDTERSVFPLFFAIRLKTGDFLRTRLVFLPPYIFILYNWYIFYFYL